MKINSVDLNFSDDCELPTNAPLVGQDAVLLWQARALEPNAATLYLREQRW